MLILVHALTVPPLAALGAVGGALWPRSELASRVARGWGRIALATCGARVTATGMERLTAHGPGVVVADHTSAVDIFLYCSLLPLPFRMVAKKQLFRIPLFGWALSAAGYVPVERTGGRRDVARLRALRWDVDRRALIAFFPEGTRSKNGRLLPFKKGAFATAIREQIPVTPVAIIGAHRVQPAGGIRVSAGPVEFRVLPPCPTVGLSAVDVERLRDQVHEQIRAQLPDDQQPLPQTAS